MNETPLRLFKSPRLANMSLETHSQMSNEQHESPDSGQKLLEAHSLNEVRYYLMVSPCPLCGKGPQEITHPQSVQAGQTSTIQTNCKNCEQAGEIQVICQTKLGEGYEGDAINPADEPSRIIDLGQWLSLFYLLIESAATDSSRTSARRGGYQGMLCLSEALKFYGDNELPPVEAFFTKTTRDIFHRHPEKFTRQGLRDMQSKLPTPASMAARVASDQQRTSRRWWQFWSR